MHVEGVSGEITILYIHTSTRNGSDRIAEILVCQSVALMFLKALANERLSRVDEPLQRDEYPLEFAESRGLRLL